MFRLTQPKSSSNSEFRLVSRRNRRKNPEKKPLFLMYLLPRRTCLGNRRRTRYRRVPVHLHLQLRQEEVQRDCHHPQEQPENVHQKMVIL